MLLLAVACGGDDGGSATPTRNLHPDNPEFDYLEQRPLALPGMGAECPVSESQLLSPTLPTVLGGGPVYPTGMGSNAVLRISEVGQGGSGWDGAPVPWLAEPEFAGKILIRGGRIDEQGPLGFDYSPVVPVEPTSDKLQFDTEDTSPDPNGYWQWHTYLRMQEPGCYALQLDTDAGTQHIIFEAVELDS
jgi:hypothetical protein